MQKKIPVINPDIVLRRDKNEALLFNPSDGSIFCINGTAMLIWDLCDGVHSIGSIVSELVNTYNVGRSEAETDCNKYIRELASSGVIGYREET